MNVKLRLGFCIATLLATGTLHAQSPASPGAAATPAAAAKESAAQTPAASPTIVPVEPPSIIPPNSLPGPDAASLPQIPVSPELELLNSFFKQTSLGKTADEHRLLVQTAELETRLRNDEDLHALRRAADNTTTDLERRHRLRKYYEAYFTKMRARATTPELLAYLKAQEATHESTLLQPRVRHETDEAEAARLATLQGGTSASAAPTPVQAKVSDVLRP